jgi:hypothetical protein
MIGLVENGAVEDFVCANRPLIASKNDSAE